VHTNIGTYDIDNCWQACTDYRSWRHNSEWMSWLVRSTDKSQSYLIVRQVASCFVNLNAPIGYCFLPRQVIPSCIRILDLMYYFIFVSLWWTRKDIIRALEWRIWTHLCVQYKLLPIQHQLLWKVFKKISIFHILCATILKEFWFRERI